MIISKFSKIPEPEFPGHVILEQYQAQVRILFICIQVIYLFYFFSTRLVKRNFYLCHNTILMSKCSKIHRRIII